MNFTKEIGNLYIRVVYIFQPKTNGGVCLYSIANKSQMILFSVV